MFTLSNEFHYLPTVAADNRGSVHVHGATTLATSAKFMDSIFLLGEVERSTLFQNIVQMFGATYICLWSYESNSLSQTFNCLQYKDGFYLHERGDQPSSSSGSLAQVSFNEYRQSLFIIDHGRHVVPGYAFAKSIPYLELKSDNLLLLARTEAQRRFYQAAGIKTAVFMGCNAGEIELGFSDQSQVNIEMEMMKLFPDDFSRQLPARELPQPTDQNRPASSSSSLRSLSYDSPEYPPFLIHDVSSTRYISENPQEAIVEQALRPSASIFTTTNPHQQAIQALSQIRCPQIPSIEREDAAMANAMLAVICSSPSSSSSSFQPQQHLPPNYPVSGHDSAFKWYRSSALAPTVPMSARFRRQNMLKRSISFLRSLNTMQTQEHNMQASRTSSTQLQHMISERRRREKLNESFQALRSLLPPGTKKDKASVLTSTTDYLSSLKAQVAELSKRNAILEAQLLLKKTAAAAEASTGSSNERLEVRITQVSESTSAARLVDLQVTRIGEISITDFVVSLLEFLKRDQNVSLMSIEANTTMEESASVNHIVLRLKIEGEWDESAFQEAVRRVVNDQPQ